MSSSKTRHVVIGPGPGQMRCRHCGDIYKIALPASMDVVIGAMKGYLETHRTCPKPKEVLP